MLLAEASSLQEIAEPWAGRPSGLAVVDAVLDWHGDIAEAAVQAIVDDALEAGRESLAVRAVAVGNAEGTVDWHLAHDDRWQHSPQELHPQLA
jgi:ketosteroid isomerase-like protein